MDVGGCSLCGSHMIRHILRWDVGIGLIVLCKLVGWFCVGIHVRMFLWRKAEVVFALCGVLLM